MLGTVGEVHDEPLLTNFLGLSVLQHQDPRFKPSLGGKIQRIVSQALARYLNAFA